MTSGKATPPAALATPPITLHAAQSDFVYTPSHYAALIGGVGSGKSFAGAVRALWASQGHLGHDQQAILVPNLGMVTAPTYNILRDATLRSFLEVADPLVERHKSAFAPPIRITLANGSEILFRSADKPELLRGPNLSWWWGDEAALYHPDVWKIMIGRLRQFRQHGYAWLTTTPRGRNWLYRRFVEPPEPSLDTVWWRMRTHDNPTLDEGFIKALVADYTGEFRRQELDAEFIGFSGLVYPEFDASRHVSADLPPPHVLTHVIAGVDFGFVNPGVIQVVGQTGDGRLYLLHEDYARYRPISEWADVAVQLRDIWHITAFHCDPSEPEYIRQLAERGLLTFKANNAVNMGIQSLKRRLATRADGLPGLLVSAAATHTIAEFEQYQWLSQGTLLVDKPLKANDHALDALRYAVIAFDTPARRAISVEVQPIF